MSDVHHHTILHCREDMKAQSCTAETAQLEEQQTEASSVGVLVVFNSRSWRTLFIINLLRSYAPLTGLLLSKMIHACQYDCSYDNKNITKLAILLCSIYGGMW